LSFPSSLLLSPSRLVNPFFSPPLPYLFSCRKGVSFGWSLLFLLLHTPLPPPPMIVPVSLRPSLPLVPTTFPPAFSNFAPVFPPPRLPFPYFPPSRRRWHWPLCVPVFFSFPAFSFLFFLYGKPVFELGVLYLLF